MQAQARRSLEQLETSASDQETIDRQRRIREGSYESFLNRAAFGMPKMVAERLQMHVDEWGITGFALDPNNGGQIPQVKVLNSIPLLMEKVAPKFKRVSHPHLAWYIMCLLPTKGGCRSTLKSLSSHP